MAERKAPVRRSVEERIAEIDAKIAAHEKHIEALKQKKETILQPKPSKAARRKPINETIDSILDSGASAEELQAYLKNFKK